MHIIMCMYVYNKFIICVLYLIHFDPICYLRVTNLTIREVNQEVVAKVIRVRTYVCTYVLNMHSKSECL